MNRPFQPIRDVVQRTVEQDVDRELDFHLEMRTEELIPAGWEPSAAREEEARSFGPRRPVAKACRHYENKRRQAERRADVFDALRIDVRFTAPAAARPHLHHRCPAHAHPRRRRGGAPRSQVGEWSFR